jgi:aminopeptidase N
MEINNFYTLTVYEKGAEVVGLYHSLLGKDGFRKGMDLYFQRHDGQAVTTEDFLAAMADANDVDLSQMQNWYVQAGTPVVDVTMDYDLAKQQCTLHFKQSCPDTPEATADEKQPFLIPVELGLLDQSGQDMPLQLDSEDQPQATSRTIKLTKAETSITFVNINEQPTPSLLRGFSAPVKLNYDYSEQDYTFLMSHDSDAFNRWQAGQDLAMQTLLGLVEAQQSSEAMGLSHDFVHAFQKVLNDDQLDMALRAEALSLPSSSDVAEKLANNVNPEFVYTAVEFMCKTLANALRIDLEKHYQALNVKTEYKADPDSMGKRRLKNLCLGYLSLIEEDEGITALCLDQFTSANNMTDESAAFVQLVNRDCEESAQAIQIFHDKWQDNAQVMDSWFAVQATSKKADTLEQVKQLLEHKLFTMNNPNKVRSLIGAFSGNYRHFHAEDGSGYQFIANKVIELDAKNPQVASRIVRSLIKWRQLEEKRSALMKTELKRISEQKDISRDVFEIVTKALD